MMPAKKSTEMVRGEEEFMEHAKQDATKAMELRAQDSGRLKMKWNGQSKKTRSEQQLSQQALERR